MQLLLRPVWRAGESWTGYLLRIAAANHMPSVRQLAKNLGVPIGELLLGPVHISLASLGIGKAGVPHVAMPKNGDDADSERLRKASRPRLTAVCPECLRTDDIPHMRARWDSPLTDTCTRHLVRLVASCPQCHSPVRTRDGPFLLCPCGIPFPRWRAERVEQTRNHLRQILDVPEAHDDELTFQPPSAKELAAFSLLRNLAYESGLAIPTPHKKVPRLSNPTDRLEILRLSTPWFDDWPNGFARSLKNSSWRPGYDGAKHLSRRALQLSAFPQLADVVDRLVMDRSSTRAKQRRELIYVHPERVSLPVARVELGLSQSLSAKWVAAGVFGPTWLGRERGNQVRVVERKAVQELKVILAGSLSLADASKHLGLPMRAVAKLVQSGILSEIRLQHHVSTARISPKDLDQLAARLLACSRHSVSVERARPLGTVIYGAFVHAGLDYVRFLFDAFYSGDLPLLRKSSDPPSLSSLYVPRLELRRFYPRVRRELAVSA